MYGIYICYFILRLCSLLKRIRFIIRYFFYRGTELYRSHRPIPVCDLIPNSRIPRVPHPSCCRRCETVHFRLEHTWYVTKRWETLGNIFMLLLFFFFFLAYKYSDRYRQVLVEKRIKPSVNKQNVLNNISGKASWPSFFNLAVRCKISKWPII